MKKSVFVIIAIALISFGCRKHTERYQISNSPFIIDTHTGDLWYYEIDSLHSKYRSKESNWIYLGQPPLKK
jgi:hypothetical protein